MVSVTSEEQFYTVAQFAVPGGYVGDMYDIYEDNSVVIVDVDRWYFVNFKKALTLKEEFGFPISFEEFEMRYLETVPTDKVMTHDDEVKILKHDKGMRVKLFNSMSEYEDYQRQEQINEEHKKTDMVNHPSHYNQFSREVIDTMQGMSTTEEFKGYLKLNAVKYLSRYQGKNGIEDLGKAIWYITKLKEVLEEEK